MYQFLFLLVCNVFSTIALQAQTPLLDAIKAGDLPELQQLVEEGADTNALDENGATPLMWAAYQGDLEMVKWLVDNGADPFLKKGVIYLNEEKTAYYGNLTGIAAGEGKVPMLRYLIEDVGIDVDDREYNPETGQEDGWTAAQWADSDNNQAILDFLKGKNADMAFLNSYYNLATKSSRLSQQGRYEEALVYAEKSVIAARDEFDMDHPSFATSLNNLALVYNSLERYKDAEPLFRRATETYKQQLGEDHPFYVQALENLAGSLQSIGRYADAEPLYIKYSQLYKQQLGEDHLDYGRSLNNLAELYVDMRSYEEAEPLYEQVLKILENQLGESHPYYTVTFNNLAALYKNMGRYREAETLYRKITEIYKREMGEDNPDYAKSINNLALFLYENMGRYGEAEQLMHKATEITKQQLGENHFDYATSLNNLALLYSSMGRYAGVEALYRKASEIYKRELGEDHPDYAKSLNNLAGLYNRMGRYREAEQLYLNATEIIKQELGKENIYYATSLGNLADLYQNMGRYKEGELLFLQALQIRKKQFGEKHIYYAKGLGDLAGLYRKMGRYGEGELLLLQALQIRKKQFGEKHIYYAAYLGDLANLYVDRGSYRDAEQLFLQSTEISKLQLGEDHPDYATSLGNIAMLYEIMGRYREAEQLYLKATEIRKAQLGEDHPNYAVSLNNLAALYKIMGRYFESETLLLKTKESFEKTLGKDHPDYAKALNNLAELYRSMGRYEEAEPLYINAMQIGKQQLGEDHPDYARSLNNLALLYSTIGQYKKAGPLYTKATEIRKAQLGEDHPDYAQSLNNLAGLYVSKGRHAEAEPMYTQAMGIQKAQLGEDHPDYASSLNNLALLYKNMGRYNEAEPLYLQGQQVYLHQLQTVFPSLSEKEKEQFLLTFNFNFEIFHSFALKRKGDNPAITAPQYDNALLLKGLLLQSISQMRERILASGDTTAIRLFEDWQALKRQWLKESETSKSEREQAGIIPYATLEKANTLEKELSSRSEAFAETTDTVRTAWQDIQQELKPGEAAIELIRYTWHDKNWTDTVHYAALIVTPETKAHPHLVLMENGTELEERGAQSYQSAFATRGASRVTDGDNPIPADSLYAYFWQPIQQALDSLGGAAKVYLSADGVYHTLNLQTLKNPETGQYLLETLDIQRVGSTRDLVIKKKQRAHNNDVVLAGFPTYPASPEAVASALERYQQGQAVPEPTPSLSSSNYGSYQTYRAINANRNSISPLPGTLAEVEQLASILNGEGISTQALLEHAASEDVLKKVKSPRILHIATHGFFEPESEQQAEDLNRKMLMNGLGRETVTENPYLRCGLYLAGAETTLKNRGNPDFQRPEGQEDGILTAYEATLLDLRSTELVVLSACETGLGVTKNGEGVYGLQRALQVAGAETVIFSLWKVADEQTQEMMGLFYGNWLEKGMSKRQAFKTAQQTIKEKYKDPYFWGAFVMIGG
ncbi:tetratricopeptide repeat protein [Cyclobacterium marinum]|uniref:tetratricopeptide repeat protein n=1 Tax=Cyclobacterium marinum TaxID=104 RepID=UPI0011ED8244|nr:tetratricopeptide repeat protein [Cyclobacterium marinum]MBI0400297.1 tetratricopeptide repeat protein [Cyclobacterium marinum]